MRNILRFVSSCLKHVLSLARGWGNLFTFGRGLDRTEGPCMWGIITVWFCLMANAPYFPGVGGGGVTLKGTLRSHSGRQLSRKPIKLNSYLVIFNTRFSEFNAVYKNKLIYNVLHVNT